MQKVVEPGPVDFVCARGHEIIIPRSRRFAMWGEREIRTRSLRVATMRKEKKRRRYHHRAGRREQHTLLAQKPPKRSLAQYLSRGQNVIYACTYNRNGLGSGGAGAGADYPTAG